MAIVNTLAGWKTGKSHLCAVCTTMLCGGGFTPFQKAIHAIEVYVIIRTLVPLFVHLMLRRSGKAPVA